MSRSESKSLDTQGGEQRNNEMTEVIYQPPTLQPYQINQKIQDRYCQVECEYGSSTGFIVDAVKGILLTSFHLAGQVKECSIFEPMHASIPMRYLHLLYVSNYLQIKKKHETQFEEITEINDVFLTEKAIVTKDTDSVDLVDEKNLNSLNKGFEITKKIRLTKVNMNAILKFDPDFKKNLFNCIIMLRNQEKMVNENLFYCLVLVEAGYFSIRTQEGVPHFIELESCSSVKSPDDIKIDHIDETKSVPWGYKVEPNNESKIIQDILSEPNIKETIFRIILRLKAYKKVYFWTGRFKVRFDDQELMAEIYYPPEKDQFKVRNVYAVYDILPLRITHFEDGTPFVDGATIFDIGEGVVSLPDNIPLIIGEPVYYGGFPLTQQDYTFSKGMISSLSRQGPRNIVVIESPVARGNSGGLVFVCRGDQLFWIGAISAGLAHVTQKMLTLQEKLEHIPEFMKSTGPYGEFGMIDAFREITNMLMDNLSTGKGKVIRVSDYQDIFRELSEAYLQFIPLDFLVPKKLVPKIKKQSLLEYMQGNNRLRMCDMVKYIRENADSETKNIFLKNTIHSKGCEINNTTIILPDGINANWSSVEIQFPNSVRDNSHKKAIKDAMKYAYELCCSINKGDVLENQIQYAKSNIPIYEECMITGKFFNDHIGESTRAESEALAANVAHHRMKNDSKIKKSTTIEGGELGKLTDEAKKLNELNIYKAAILCINEFSHGKVVKSIYFMTLGVYHLITLSPDENNKKSQLYKNRAKRQFFYSVIERNNKHYIHHYVGNFENENALDECRKKNGWAELPLDSLFQSAVNNNSANGRSISKSQLPRVFYICK